MGVKGFLAFIVSALLLRVAQATMTTGTSVGHWRGHLAERAGHFPRVSARGVTAARQCVASLTCVGCISLDQPV
jgi:hypothetical protein